MKKSIIALSSLLIVAGFMMGCAYTMTNPSLMGGVYSSYKGPVSATDQTLGPKMGKAKVESILGIVAMGDASIATAAKNGGITKISHVDFENTNILFIYSTYTVIVYGE